MHIVRTPRLSCTKGLRFSAELRYCMIKDSTDPVTIDMDCAGGGGMDCPYLGTEYRYHTDYLNVSARLNGDLANCQDES